MHARKVGDTTLTFGVSGNLWRDALVMYDRETESLWSTLTGECIEGEYLGMRLESIDAILLPFAEWRERYPESRVLPRPAGTESGSRYESYFDSNRQGIFGTQAARSELAPKELVQGVAFENEAAAIPHGELADGERVAFELGSARFEARRVGSEIQIWRGEGEAATRFPSTTVFWFGWLNFYPGAEVVRP